MVSINTSTSFLGTQKFEKYTSEEDISGLENLFASLISITRDENNPLNGSSISEANDEVMLVLAEIKNKLDVQKNGSNLVEGIENNSEQLSANVLQIYHSYKTMIDEALASTEEATVTFDIELLPEPNLTGRNLKIASTTAVDREIELPISDMGKATKLITLSESKESIEEFSELEMLKIRASLKQGNQMSSDLEKNAKKTTSKVKDSQESVILGTKSSETKNYLGKDNISSNLDQTNQDGNRPNQMVDLSKSDSLVDQSQPSNKTSTNRSTAPEPSLQSSQNAYETQLKLLEKNWGKDLAKIIERAIISGKEKIDISLDPQKLGKMHLTLSVVNNQTSIFITTENAATSLILNSAEDRLAQMFESSGYKLSNFQANSNANHNSNRNGPGSKQNKDTKKIDPISDKPMLPEENNTISKTLDGRKIINIIA
jgi:hypothetical protein